MRVTVITPCFNAERFIDRCLDSVLSQAGEGVAVESIVMDGGSTDSTVARVRGRGDAVHTLVSEPDQGPADAINKGFSLASGEIIAWLNADDEYTPGALARVVDVMQANPEAPFCFGHCPVIDAQGTEIRKGVTRVKRACYPVSSRFTFQCINYISQPAMFFRKGALDRAGPLRLDLKAAWDYEFLLRLWRQGKGVPVADPPLARFRWTPDSISGQHFRQQFDEEFRAAKADAGTWRLQTLIHFGVKWGIIGMYSLMTRGEGQDA